MFVLILTDRNDKMMDAKKLRFSRLPSSGRSPQCHSLPFPAPESWLSSDAASTRWSPPTGRSGHATRLGPASGRAFLHPRAGEHPPGVLSSSSGSTPVLHTAPQCDGAITVDRQWI